MQALKDHANVNPPMQISRAMMHAITMTAVRGVLDGPDTRPHRCGMSPRLAMANMTRERPRSRFSSTPTMAAVAAVATVAVVTAVAAVAAVAAVDTVAAVALAKMARRLILVWI